MMSQENPLNCTLVPKKFLKKGEGLKRFAAYKPPPPVSCNKVKRRQTFVKFTLDDKPLKKGQTPTYLPPEILYNDSINLSTEIPKIAPPKIMHTPIRPNRLALGTLAVSNFNCDPGDDSSSDSEQIYNPYRPKIFTNRTPIKPKINHIIEDRIDSPSTNNHVLESLPDRNLTRKVATIQANPLDKKISFDGFRKPSTPSPILTHPPVAQSDAARPPRQVETEEIETDAPRRYNLRGSRKPNSESAPTKKKATKTEPKVEPKKTRRQLKAIVERHISPAHEDFADKVEDNCITDSQINGNIDELMRKIEERKKSSPISDEKVSEDAKTPELDDRVSEPEDSEPLQETPITTNTSHRMKYSQPFDLSSPSPGSFILALGQQIQHIESTVNVLKENLKKCECGAFSSNTKSATTTRSTRKTSRARASEKTRPSADADNSTYKILSSLEDGVAQLKARFDEIDLTR